MFAPMGATGAAATTAQSDMTAPSAQTQVGNFRADGLATGVMALTTVFVLLNLAFYVAAGYGVYKFFKRERS